MSVRRLSVLCACLLIGLSLVGCGKTAAGTLRVTEPSQVVTPVPQPEITEVEAKALCDRFLADGASPLTCSMLNKKGMGDPVIKSFDLQRTMGSSLDAYVQRLAEAKSISPAQGNRADMWGEGAIPQAKASFAASNTIELFDLAWSGLLNDEGGTVSGKFPHTPAALVASSMLTDMLSPLGVPKRSITLVATNTISVVSTGQDGDGVAHRYVVEKRDDAWVIVGMPTLGDSEVAFAKRIAVDSKKTAIKPTAAELKKAFGKNQRIWIGPDSNGEWWVALQQTIDGGGVMRDEVYAYMAHRLSSGSWAKYDLGAPDGRIQVNSISAPVPQEVIAAMRKEAGLLVNVTNQ